jgi:lipopolysaccharide/colanic/teichoic acid biosynthesis glycosyltransferase
MIVKRFLDVFLACIALVLIAPMLLVVAVLIRIRMGNPVLFRQIRPGLGGRPFEVIKFRTMRDGNDSDADRLTPLGRFLRRTSLDELPELWNVIRGEMSLVGPRPLLLGYLDLYTQDQARRHDVLPGITGWAQVNGRNRISWAEKLSMDVWYVDHHSIWLDFKILAITPLKVFGQDGISKDGHATTDTFSGTKL